MSFELSMKHLFTTHAPIAITKNMCTELIRWNVSYEVRDKYPEVLNSPLLAIYPMHFFPKDINALFDILKVDKEQFKKAVKMCPNINKQFKVTSDLYNLLTIYAAHCLLRATTINQSLRDDTLLALFKMLHYKFFTSVVYHRLKFGADPGIMQATIEQMSRKFDIIKPATSTWKLVMEARSKDIYDKKSIHYQALYNFTPDKSVLYALSDPQTRLRTKLRLVINAYMENHAKGSVIGNTTLIDTRGEEKTIKDLTASYDVMIANITNNALNANQFIKHKMVELVVKLVPNIRPDTMRTVLMRFSVQATSQYQKRQQTDMSKDNKLIIGYAALIDAIIQRTYRMCILDKVNMKSPLDILNRSRDMYRSSRIADAGILQVKDSVGYFVDSLKVTTREATKSSLRIAFVLYIILLSFDYGA